MLRTTDDNGDEARVRAVLQRLFRCDAASLAPDVDLIERLSLDSLDSLHVLAALERELGIRFDDTELEMPRTMRGLVELVARSQKEEPCGSG